MRLAFAQLARKEREHLGRDGAIRDLSGAAPALEGLLAEGALLVVGGSKIAEEKRAPAPATAVQEGGEEGGLHHRRGGDIARGAW
ncbi:MAG: hypothetical protein ACMG6S_06190 [Byssovorax sp.]